MSILTLCPSVSVSANKTSKETEIPTTSIDKKEISSSKSQTFSETVKEYIKNNLGKSAAEITIFIAILVIGGYLILNRNRQTTPRIGPEFRTPGQSGGAGAGAGADAGLACVKQLKGFDNEAFKMFYASLSANQKKAFTWFEENLDTFRTYFTAK